MKKLLLAFTALIVTLSLAFCGSDNQAKELEQKNSDAVTQKIDDLFVFSAYDTKGTLRNSTEWIGQKPVVINFWGTWCPPCRMEIPDLVKLYGEYRNQGVEIIGIALRDNAQQVSQFAGQNNMDWVMLVGDMPLAQKFQISSVPTTYFIDKNGHIMQVFEPTLGQKADFFKGAKSYNTFKAAFEDLIKL